MACKDLASSTFADVTKKKEPTLRIHKIVKTYRDTYIYPTEKVSPHSRPLPVRKFKAHSPVTPPFKPSGKLPIRKYTITPIFTVHTAIDSYNRTTKAISRLTEEYRAIMSEIRRRERQRLRLIKIPADYKKNRLYRQKRSQSVTQSINTIPRTMGRVKYSMRGKGKMTISRPRCRAKRRVKGRVSRRAVVRQIVYEKERSRKDNALRVFMGKREQRRMKELEDRVGGWLGGGS